MVRRRSLKPAVVVPSWVRAHVPSDWPGETALSRWMAWRVAVTDYCNAHRLLSLDFTTWLDVKNNVYRTRAALWHDAAEQYRSAGRALEDDRKA